MRGFNTETFVSSTNRRTLNKILSNMYNLSHPLTLSMKDYRLWVLSPADSFSSAHTKNPNGRRVHSSPFKSFNLCCSAHFAPSGFHTIRGAFPVKCFFCGHTDRIVKKKEAGIEQSEARLQPSDGIRNLYLWPEVPYEYNLFPLLPRRPKQWASAYKHERLNLKS